jgi:spore maturation protein CgeB
MLVGAWSWPQYEAAFASALERHGVQVFPFSSARFFLGRLGRLQEHLPLPGPAMARLNRAVAYQATQARPDIVLFWRPTHILPGTIKKIRDTGIRTVSYNNDDPFGPSAHGRVPLHHRWLWQGYLKCLPHFDRNFFYRRINCDEALYHGAGHADVLMPYFMPWRDRPVDLSAAELERFSADVVFVGHYEPDGREQAVRSLVEAGIQLKIWGGELWTRKVLGDVYDRLHPIIPALGDDYAKALCGAKINLAFLSKLNRDTYTRRCFEIPACGQVMLAERTDDLLGLFKENVEACYFSTHKELVDKVRWLLQNPGIRDRIAKAGLRRVWADGHDVSNRAAQFLAALGPAKASQLQMREMGCVEY